MIGKIQKWGNSQGVRIPKPLLQAASLQEEDEVEITAEYNKLIIRRVTKEKVYNIKELFANYQTKEKSPEENWGPPVGQEEW